MICAYRGSPISYLSRPLKNVFEAADARQKQAKKRSLCIINEHFEPVFNTAAATQIVFQRPVRMFDNRQGMADLEGDDYKRLLCVETTNAADDVREVAPGGECRLAADYRVVRG